MAFLSKHFNSALVICQPPLWSSGQSSWLQIRSSGSIPGTTKKKKVVGLERGPLSLVSTTEELLDRKVAAITSPTSGGRSVGKFARGLRPWSFFITDRCVVTEKRSKTKIAFNEERCLSLLPRR
jgi:hypothetical protein